MRPSVDNNNFSKRIIGGNRAKFAELPWQVRKALPMRSLAPTLRKRLQLIDQHLVCQSQYVVFVRERSMKRREETLMLPSQIN